MIFRKVLRRMRRISVINYPVRKIVKSIHELSKNLVGRWPVSGVINCRFDDLNFKFYDRCDDHQANFFYYNKPFHEHKVIRLMCAFARKSRVIMDIGANTGIHSVIVAKKCPNIKVYSIEPYRTNYLRLEKNLAINDCSNVEVRKIALGEAEDQIVLYVPIDDSITDVSSAVENHAQRIYEDQVRWKKSEVKQSTLDRLSEEIGQIDFFKCDVESYEMHVFKGAMQFFSENRPPFILEITLSEEKVDFFNDFAGRLNYHIYFVGEEGLVRLDRLYNFDRWPNFLFSQYKSEHNFIPNKLIEEFVEKAFQVNSMASLDVH